MKSLNYGGHFDVDAKEIRIDTLSKQTEEVQFWDDKEKANAIIEELNLLKRQTATIKQIKDEIDSNIEIVTFLEEINDDDLLNQVCTGVEQLEEDIEKVSNEILLSGEYDNLNAIIEIHAGAGGTESCDWVSMLYRMYLRWSETNNYKVELIDEQKGEEAGYKSVSFIIKGTYAFGYLKSEKGVHRLVRISPFDSGGRRHTSFASVLVVPEFDKTIQIDLNESDLKIDVYRSSGAGGQSVNTTDSAVRITHLPTGIVVTCQNERSQIQNREKALNILKSKLYQLALDNKIKTINDLRGKVEPINFGSQIRSYVMHPYSMVKDHRTDFETSNVDKVLDGSIDGFIHAYLKEEVHHENA